MRLGNARRLVVPFPARPKLPAATLSLLALARQLKAVHRRLASRVEGRGVPGLPRKPWPMKYLLGSLLLFSLLAAPAAAVPVVVADLPSIASSGRSVGAGIASPFTVGATPLALTSVETAIGYFLTPNPGGTGLSLGLYTDVGGTPGSLITSLLLTTPLSPSLSAINGLFVPTLPTSLAANTSYWVSAFVLTPGPVFFWARSATWGDVPLSPDGGATWNLSFETLPALRVMGDDALAAGVPEIDPRCSALPLALLVGLVGLATGRRQPAALSGPKKQLVK